MADIREQIKKLQKDIKCLKCTINEVAANDIYVDGGSFDPGTLTLTLTDTNAGTPDVEINLSALVPDTLYSANGSIPAATARTVTLGAGSSLVISGGFAGTLFNIDGDSGKVTMDGLLDPSGLQVTPQASNPGSAQTYWSNSTDSNNPYFGPDRLARFSELIADDQGLDEVLAINNNTGANNIVVATSQYIAWTNSGFLGRIIEGTFTANRTYTLPDNTGTIALVSDIPAPSGDGIYDGSGTIPTSTVATLTDYFNFTVSGTNGVSIGPSSFATTHALEVRAISANQNCVIQGFNNSSGQALIVSNSLSALAVFNNSGHIALAQTNGHSVSIGNGTGDASTLLTVRGDGTTSATKALVIEDSTGANHLIVADNGQVSYGIGQSAVNPSASYGERHNITGFTYGAAFVGNNCTTATMLVQATGTTDWGIYSVIQGSTFTGDSVAIYGNNLNTNNPTSVVGVRGSGRNGSSVSVGVDGAIPGGASFASSSYVAAVRGQATPNVDNGVNYGGYFLSSMNNATLAFTGDFIGAYGRAVTTSGDAGSTSKAIGGMFLASGTVGGDKIALLVPSTNNAGTVVFGADNPSGTVMLQVTGELELFGNGDGFYMYQPDGTRRRITLDNAGAFVIT